MPPPTLTHPSSVRDPPFPDDHAGGLGGRRPRGSGRGDRPVPQEPQAPEEVLRRGDHPRPILVPGAGAALAHNEDGSKVEYTVWNPFRSKLVAAMLGGVDNIWIAPRTRVLYLGAASGTTMSHVSDIVGPLQ
ncbi:hypothetical protein ZWY2020_039014 [Hordeum vulgare]|nr:hypothetical protein ZWY2020_039014 [Hordeum vulgare]